jgi:hypothetical protein
MQLLSKDQKMSAVQIPGIDKIKPLEKRCGHEGLNSTSTMQVIISPAPLQGFKLRALLTALFGCAVI